MNIHPDHIQQLLNRTTPGPWRLSEEDPLEVWADRDPTGWDADLVATTRTRLNPDGIENSVGDTELIALAPDLAKAYLELAAALRDRRDDG